jgi:LAO/AO transport system kinase
VLVPESGDAVQAMKAGLMEIGDVFVINKADREGADRAASAIRMALELRPVRSQWEPPVFPTVAVEARGVEDVVEGLEEHLEYLRRHGGLERRRRLRLEQRLRDLLRDQLWEELRSRVPERLWRASVDDLAARRCTPRQAAGRMMEMAMRENRRPRG